MYGRTRGRMCWQNDRRSGNPSVMTDVKETEKTDRDDRCATLDGTSVIFPSTYLQIWMVRVFSTPSILETGDWVAHYSPEMKRQLSQWLNLTPLHRWQRNSKPSFRQKKNKLWLSLFVGPSRNYCYRIFTSGRDWYLEKILLDLTKIGKNRIVCEFLRVKDPGSNGKRDIRVSRSRRIDTYWCFPTPLLWRTTTVAFNRILRERKKPQTSSTDGQ